MKFFEALDGFCLDQVNLLPVEKRLGCLRQRFVDDMRPYDNKPLKQKVKQIFPKLKKIIGANWANSRPLDPPDYNPFSGGFLSHALNNPIRVDRLVVLVIYQHFASLIGVIGSIVKLALLGDYIRIQDPTCEEGFFLVDLNDQGRIKLPSEVRRIYEMTDFEPSTTKDLLESFIISMAVDIDELNVDQFEEQRSCLLGVQLSSILFNTDIASWMVSRTLNVISKHFPLDIHIYDSVISCAPAWNYFSIISSSHSIPLTAEASTTCVEPPRKRRRKRSVNLYRIGQICRFRNIYALGSKRLVEGVIIGWDSICDPFTFPRGVWNRSDDIVDLYNPYYMVLTNSTYNYYVPQSAITILSLKEEELYYRLGMGPCILGKYFETYDPGKKAFTPNFESWAQYPDYDVYIDDDWTVIREF